ncbi:hypothetical protein J3B02_004165 [Coemansia erecta]|nr:hypothetical protein J3B02_004165 [Coemansia erecta]
MVDTVAAALDLVPASTMEDKDKDKDREDMGEGMRANQRINRRQATGLISAA